MSEKKELTNAEKQCISVKINLTDPNIMNAAGVSCISYLAEINNKSKPVKERFDAIAKMTPQERLKHFYSLMEAYINRCAESEEKKDAMRAWVDLQGFIDKIGDLGEFEISLLVRVWEIGYKTGRAELEGHKPAAESRYSSNIELKNNKEDAAKEKDKYIYKLYSDALAQQTAKGEKINKAEAQRSVLAQLTIEGKYYVLKTPKNGKKLSPVEESANKQMRKAFKKYIERLEQVKKQEKNIDLKK